MNGERRKRGGNGQREQVTFSLPADLVETLKEFCRDKKVVADIVVERALEEYFREGDMSH